MALPSSLSTMGIIRLQVLNNRCERLLKAEIDRVSRTNLRFARLLDEALQVEDEIARRNETGSQIPD